MNKGESVLPFKTPANTRQIATGRTAKCCRFRLWLVAWLAAGLLAFPDCGVRATPANSDFPASLSLGGHRLQMKGRGVLRAYGVFVVSEVALYGPGEVSARRLLSLESAKCVRIRFLAAVSRIDFVRIVDAHLRALYDPPQLARYETRIDSWHRAYPDSREGDELSFCFQPRIGLSMTHNQRRLVSVPGHDFAKVILGLLLGESPLSNELKQSLLDGAT